jgi:gas vesicle protein
MAAEAPCSRIAITQAEDGSMEKALITAVIGGFIVASAAVIYAADSSSRTRLILGSGPITEQQIRDKLTADGFSNIQISPQGNLLETIATKNGRPIRLEIDSQSGTIFQARGADDDDDDD